MNEWFRFDSGTVESGVFIGEVEEREVVLHGHRLGFDGMPGDGFYPCEERVQAFIQSAGPNDKFKDFGFMYGESRSHSGSITHEIQVVLLVPPRTFEDVVQMTLSMNAGSELELDVDTAEPIENGWFKPLPTVVGEAELPSSSPKTNQFRLDGIKFRNRLVCKPIEVEEFEP